MKQFKDESLLEQYYAAAEQERLAEAKKESLRTAIIKALGTHTDGISPHFQVSLTKVHQERFDTKSFEAAHPDTYRTFLTPSSYVKLTIKARALS